MAKTLKVNVSFPMTIVVNTDAVNSLTEVRATAREALEVAAAAGEKIAGEKGAMIRLFAGDMTDEALLELIMRKGIRDFIRDDMRKELNTSETKTTVGDVRVTFEPFKAPEARIDCIQCRTLAGAGRTYKCTQCRSVEA